MAYIYFSSSCMNFLVFTNTLKQYCCTAARDWPALSGHFIIYDVRGPSPSRANHYNSKEGAFGARQCLKLTDNASDIVIQ